MDATGRIRAMTWNIHGGIGGDGRLDLARMLALVRRVNPDILALQELDSRGLGRAEHPLRLFERVVGRPGVHAAAITTADGDYGQALLSRWPMQATAVHDISIGNCEPRRVVEATVQSPIGEVHVLATHLGLSFLERRRQMRKLAALICKPARATLVLGDFNDWMWPGSVQRYLAQILPSRTHQRTFPAHFPLLKLDRIYCRPRGALVSCWTEKDGAASSDHLPLVADVEIPA